MTDLSDLSRLLGLRALREERARTVVSTAAARLKDAERAATIADAELKLHDSGVSQQEKRFFFAMGMRPISGNELGRSRDLLNSSDTKRETLIATRDGVTKSVAEREAELAAAQTEWRQRTFARDKLAEAENRLRRRQHRRGGIASELEEEEMSAGRAWTS